MSKLSIRPGTVVQCQCGKVYRIAPGLEEKICTCGAHVVPDKGCPVCDLRKPIEQPFGSLSFQLLQTEGR